MTNELPCAALSDVVSHTFYPFSWLFYSKWPTVSCWQRISRQKFSSTGHMDVDGLWFLQESKVTFKLIWDTSHNHKTTLMPHFNTVMPTVWYFHTGIIRLLLEMNMIHITVLDGVFVWQPSTASSTMAVSHTQLSAYLWSVLWRL